MIIYPLQLANATPETLENVFKRFLELQAAWKDRLAELVASAEKEANADNDGEHGEAANSNDMIINP